MTLKQQDDWRKPIHVLSVGPFGRAVGAAFKELMPKVPGVPEVLVTALRDDESTVPALWPTANIHILAAWRPVRALSRAFDEMCHRWRTPFIEAVMETPLLRVGPVVVPGSGSCRTCYEKRTLQHASRPAQLEALWGYYDANPGRGPQGYLAPFVEIAALRLAQFVDELKQNSDVAAGSVWELDVVSRITRTGKVVGIHGCPRCGLGRDESTRSFSEMLEELFDFYFEPEFSNTSANQENVVAA